MADLYRFIRLISFQSVLLRFQSYAATITTTTARQRQQRWSGGTGGSEKLDSSNQPRHTQGREKRRPSTINVVGMNQTLVRDKKFKIF